MSKSRTYWLTETRPPGHTRAAADSKAKPRRTHVGARCAVVAKRVEKTATPAGALGERKGKPKATEEEHPEHLRCKTRVERGRAAREKHPRQRTSLGSEQGARLVREAWPHCCSQEETIGVLNCHSLPTTMSWTDIIRIGEPMGTFTVGQSVPLRRTEPHVLQTRSCDDCPLDVGIDVGHHCSSPPTWSSPLPGDVNGPCATHRPNWTRKTPAGLSKLRKPNPPKAKGNVATGHVVWLCGAAVLNIS